MKKALIISIIIFVIIACVALHIVLNKGHVGTYALVQIDDAQKEEEVIQPKLILELEQDYLLSTKKKETVPIKVSIEGEGEVLLENVELESSDEEVVKINDEYEFEYFADMQEQLILKMKESGLSMRQCFGF